MNQNLRARGRPHGAFDPMPAEGVEISDALPQFKERAAWMAEVPEAIIDIPIDDDDEVECWCGAVGKISELYDDSGLESSCGGLGIRNCFCGGDLCVCHHHGETDCIGCPDCEEDEGDEEP